MEAEMAAKKTGRKWSANVTEHSDALDIEEGIFASEDPKKIAASLKRSAEHSRRRKGTPFQSAMSMLNFYINRAGKELSAAHKTVLERAKDELREQFGKKETRAAKH
jgi:translation initiation factor 2 alpha subunit (eIF-2alpha)